MSDGYEDIVGLPVTPELLDKYFVSGKYSILLDSKWVDLHIGFWFKDVVERMMKDGILKKDE